jgi:hypothetical protein
MSDKKTRLIARSKETVRAPLPHRFEDNRAQKKGYRVVAVSLYTPEADWIDQAAKALQEAGNSKANRSLVVREAILRLQGELQDKTSAEVLHNFNQYHAKRVQ